MTPGRKKCLYVLGTVLLYLAMIGMNHRDKEEEPARTVSGQNIKIEKNQEEASYEERKRVALTFDDGPGESTERLLDGLKERNVKATFFVVGEKALQYPKTIKRMKEEGHIIGNHTYSHVNLNSMSCETAMEEVRRNSDLIEELTGERPVFLRPPYGECAKKMKKELDMFIVLWDVDPLDWSVQNTGAVTASVLSDVRDNDTILLHDIFDTSVDAALQIVDNLQKENYEFVTVEELMFP